MGKFRKILTIVTLILVVVVVWGAREDIMNAIGYLANTNLWFVLLLIPEQLFMYYCAGQIFFSYMIAKQNTGNATTEAPADTPVKDAPADAPTKNTPPADSSSSKPSEPVKVKPLTSWMLARISFELNFVNNAIPSGGFAGLGYMTWRLREFGSSAGQTSFMYVLRYVITILANQLQTIIAILILVLVGGIADGAWWVVGLTSLICIGIVMFLVAIIVIASSQKRIAWFSRVFTNLINSIVKFFTFGHKRQVLAHESIENYMEDIYKDLVIARRNKKILLHPILWGVAYSFLEVATYWLVGVSMGHVEILPQIMIAEAIASVIGAVMLTPGGVGGYEGTMIFVMSVLGVNPGLATAVVITTRVVVLIGTIVSGYGFYQNAVSKIGKKEREKIMHEVGE